MNIGKEKQRILSVYYSQTGQLYDITRSITQPIIRHENCEVEYFNIAPDNPYPFPWHFFDFFKIFPECVYSDPPKFTHDDFLYDKEFDLIILSYQVWFLSPSLPMSSFMQSDLASKLLKNKPVITVIGCRNMWFMAQEEMKRLLNRVDANLVGNIVLVDEFTGMMNFVATPLWMLTGKKGPRFKGLIPRAGVSNSDIIRSSRFGDRIVDNLASGKAIDNTLFNGLNGNEINSDLIKSEKIARKSFLIWGKLIRSVSGQDSLIRKPLICLYVVFLAVMILTVVPVNLLINSISQRMKIIKLK